MPTEYWERQLQRTKVLKLARDLARSGQHENHQSILMELEVVEGFAEVHRCLTDRVICAQLDRLCAMAHASAQAGVGSCQSSASRLSMALRSRLSSALRRRPERSCLAQRRPWRALCMRNAMRTAIAETS